MKHLIAYCGLDCQKCEAHIATINNDDELRREVASKWSELNYFGESDYWIAQTRFGFPSVGRSDVLYQAIEENAIYQWDENSLSYVYLKAIEEPLDIEIINGGNANVN